MVKFLKDCGATLDSGEKEYAKQKLELTKLMREGKNVEEELKSDGVLGSGFNQSDEVYQELLKITQLLTRT